MKTSITKACIEKGVSAIQLVIGNHATGSLLLKENVLVFVLEGELEFFHGETATRATKHQMVFLRKNVSIGYSTGKTGAENICIRFLLFVLDMQVVLEFAQLGHSRSGAVPTAEMVVDDGSDTVISYMAALQAYLYDGKCMKVSLVRIKLLELLFCISGSSPKMIEQILAVHERYHADIARIVEENITNVVSLKQLARLAGRSLSSFRRDFLFIYNMPPSRYIRHKRLDKAKELLLSTNMPVTNICYDMGFESIAHFSRIFKTRFGYPPSALRVNLQLTVAVP
ncbi:helix-turn-helix domain-containing protein [Longitalea arenae]|uniref:helix-turn-helix domain-containing protein n=1 Tax=Longitalea arenae TaxID=2812558 RepID=UPI0019670B44|nr:AraC family transcriptional regulator [Longitalea arenae]